ncbi:MAG: hypothetical protein WCZ43_04560 [Proteiniphilum sp.]
MKKIALFLILLLLFCRLSAQNELPYKPFEAFNNDTLAFMDYNFRQRAEYYKGKTVGKVLEDISLPIKSFTRYMRGNTTICVIVNADSVYREFKSNYIRIFLQTPVESRKLVKLMGGNPNSMIWTPEIYEFLKNEKVKSVWPNHYRLLKEKGIQM